MIALAEGNIANNKKELQKLGKKDEAKKEELREQNVNEGILLDTLTSLRAINVKDQQIRDMREKMLEEGRKQVDTLGVIAADNTRLTDLLQLYADAQRKVASKKAFGAAQEILQLSVTGGDPEQIRAQMRSQFETGINALTRVDTGNRSTGRARAALIAQAEQRRADAGAAAFIGLTGTIDGRPDFLNNERAEELFDSGNIVGAAEALGFDADKVREEMDKVGFSFTEAAKKLREADIEDSLSSLVRFSELAALGLKSTNEITSQTDETIKGFIERGGDITEVSTQLKGLNLQSTTQAAVQFQRALALSAQGLYSAAALEQDRARAFDNAFQLQAQSGKAAFETAQIGLLQLQKISAEAATVKELEAKQKLLNNAREHELLTTDQLRQKTRELADQMAETGNLNFDAFVDALTAELEYSQADFQKDILALNRDFVRDFKSGTASAFGEAIKGTKTLKAAFSDLFANLADKMLDKSLNMATNTAFSFLGFNKGGYVKGYSSGGIVKGGSGIKDDATSLPESRRICDSQENCKRIR